MLLLGREKFPQSTFVEKLSLTKVNCLKYVSISRQNLVIVYYYMSQYGAIIHEDNV